MKRNGSKFGQIAHTLAMMSMVAWSVMPAGRLYAGPTGESVQAGSADFVRDGSTTVITASNGAIINYDSFNIGSSETVQFVQPDSTSRVLNRITGSDPTQIDGTLLSNGIVYIVNPAGVYFGQGAVVNVGGIYTAAAQLTNSDFLSGIDHFTDVSGSVVNRGTIDGSLVALIGQHVANYGTINAPGGMVTMLAGDDVLITTRDRHFSVRITGMGAEAKRDAAAAAASASGAAVENHGTINADGGQVVWGAGDVYAMGLFNTGTVKAADVQATANGSDAVIAGTIDASSATGNGGDVAITGKNVTVSGTIDASGATAGGTIKVGGNARGEGELANAETTTVEQGAVLKADATGDGDAGSIVVWSDNSTYFRGSISARAYGDGLGGDAEVSGKLDLNFSFAGGIDLRSSNGSAGTLLLDPGSVSIDHAADDTLLTGGTIHDGSINAFLAGDTADLVISTANGTDAGTEDLTSTADSVINWSTARSLTLTGNNSVTLNGTVTATNAAGNFSLTGGNITVANTVSLNGGDFTVNGTSYAGNAAVTTSGGAVNITTSGNQTYAAGAINAGSGNVTLTTTGAGNINEAVAEPDDASEQAEIITTGHLTMLASGTGSIGSNPTSSDTNNHSFGLFDVDAPWVDIQVSAGNGNIQVKDLAAAGVDVNKLSVNNGYVRFDSVGAMTLENNAVVVNNTTSGYGFAWLISDSTIDAANPGNLVITTGTGSNLRIDAAGDVGTSANPLVVDTSGLFIVMNRGPFFSTGGNASFYAENQRSGTLNIVSMMLDQGEASVVSPGTINVSDYSSEFNTSFLGSGDLSLVSQTGSILAPSTITMNGGAVTLLAGDNAGVDGADVGSSATPINITGAKGLTIVADNGSGDAYITTTSYDDSLTDMDPTAFAPISVTSANTNVNITSDGTDITFTKLQLPDPSGTFNLAANSVSGDIHIASGAIVTSMSDTTQSLTIQADAGSIDLGLAAIDGGQGRIVLKALGSTSNITVTDNSGANILNDVISGTTGSGKVELTAGNSIGTALSPVWLSGTTDVSLNVNQDIYVKHDGTTDITSLSVAADPDQTGATPIYRFTNFAGESYGDGGTNHIIAVNDGTVDSLLLNDVITTSTGTNYSFTAKTGNLYVDDNGTSTASAMDTANGTAGDGGISSGSGNVTLIAAQGSVLQEIARNDGYNITTATVESTYNSGTNVDTVGPLVTLIARGNGSSAAGSIGGDYLADTANHFNIANAQRIVLDAQDDIAIAGNGQSFELLDITADPTGPGVSPRAPHYDVDDTTFSNFNFAMTSDGTDLTISQLWSTYTFDTAAQGTAFAVRNRTNDMIVGADAIRTALVNYDPLIVGNPTAASSPSQRSVRLQSDQGDIVLAADDDTNGAINVTSADGLTSGGGAGTVTLLAYNQIREQTANLHPKVRSSGLLELYADAAGNTVIDSTHIADSAIGSTPLTGASNPSLQTAVASLVAQVGLDNMYVFINSRDNSALTGIGGRSGSVNVSNTGNLSVVNVDTYNGNVDIRSSGTLNLASNAIVAGTPDNTTAATGNGNVTLYGATGIDNPGSSALNIQALMDQIILLAAGDIGSTAAINFEAAYLAGQNTGSGSIFNANDVDTAVADGLEINARTGANADALLGDIAGIAANDGNITVETVNDMLITGTIANGSSGSVSLTTSGTTTSITFDNLGSVDATHGGISGTGSIYLSTDAVLIDSDVILNSAGGSINVGEYDSRAATLDSTGSNHYTFAAEAPNGYILFNGDVGAATATSRLGSLTATTPFGIYIDGDVLTSGGTQNYFGPVYVMATNAHYDDSGTSRSAGIHFHSTIDAYNDGGTYTGNQGLSITVNSDGSALDTAGTDPEVPTISFAGNVGSDTPLMWLRVGAYDADAAATPDFTDNVADIDGRTTLPTVASIVVANEYSDGSTNPDRGNPIDWTVNVQKDFTMGRGEKLTAIGSVTLNANTGGTLTSTDVGLRLSDINADRTLTLNANNTAVVLLNRDPVAGGSVLLGPDTGILYPTDANGNGALDEFADDNGLDFWGRDGIHLNNAASVTLDDPLAASVRWYSVSAANISGTAGVGTTTSLGYFPLITRSSGAGLTVLDLIPLNANYNLGTIYPPPFPQLDDSIRLALTRQQFMDQLLVITRDAAGSERLRRVLGNATFDDMGARSGGGSDTVLNRIREDMVPIVLKSYDALFYTHATDASGADQSTPRFDQIRQTLADGVSAYQAGAGAAPTDPIKFRTYFEQTGESPETLALLNSLRDLFTQMAQLGLTDREWSNALYAIAAKIAPAGISPDFLVLAALGQSAPPVAAQ